MKTKIVIDLLRYWGNHCDAHISNGEYQVEGSVLLKSAAQKIERLCEDVSERNEKIGKLKKNNRKLRKELAERKAAPEWISVEERMPEKMGELCLVYRKSGDINLSVYFNHYWNYGDVTHWMPIPEPPKPKVKTYKDVFLDAFPNADTIEKGTPRVCRLYIFSSDTTQQCEGNYRCEDCWNQPYPEEDVAAEVMAFRVLSAAEEVSNEKSDD